MHEKKLSDIPFSTGLFQNKDRALRLYNKPVLISMGRNSLKVNNTEISNALINSSQ